MNCLLPVDSLKSNINYELEIVETESELLENHVVRQPALFSIGKELGFNFSMDFISSSSKFNKVGTKLLLVFEKLKEMNVTIKDASETMISVRLLKLYTFMESKTKDQFHELFSSISSDIKSKSASMDKTTKLFEHFLSNYDSLNKEETQIFYERDWLADGIDLS